jgi:N,N-dimethylformamidase beta subunit-like protein/concanavalin A-like lectin/glucanase superfamily protein
VPIKGENVPRENSLPIWLSGIHAYAEKSVAAGKMIHFRVSSDIPYQLSVVRLGADSDSPALDEEIHRFAPAAPNQQPIHPGSYVNIEPSIPAYQALSALTLECWIRPWALDSWQGILTQYTTPDACGFGLFITSEGKAAFYVGDGTNNGSFLIGQTELRLRQWHHIVGVWDGSQISLWIDGQLDLQNAFSGVVKPGLAPLRLGAYGENAQTCHFLDGDLAMPVIYERVLTADEIQARCHSRALEMPNLEDMLGCWPLWEERGEEIEDVSIYRRHGQIINLATWMIGGPSFDHNAVPRFGHYDPEEDTRRGHGLRFASDDLYDCGWGVTHAYRIPEDTKPGIYVGRIRFGDNMEFLYDVTCVIRKAPNRPKARMLVLCASSTWLAYNATAFVVNNASTDYRQYWGTNGRENSHPAAPAYSCYRSHRCGQPTSKMGLRMPWPDAQPYVLYSPQDVGYSHLMRSERFTHIWLDQQGYDYDVITDFDLHRDPSILDDYDVFMMNGHSEYWSLPAYKAVEGFLHRGGNLIVLSGNTMFWRISYDDDQTVMECHKLLGIPGGDTPIGEIFHSHDGLRGSMMRECDYPAYDLIGMESVGYWNDNVPQAYTCMTPDFFLFKRPHDTNLKAGETFAHGAVGHEWDVRVTLPEQGNLPYSQPGMILLGQCKRGNDDSVWDYFMRPISGEAVISEMIYWERPKGGRIFYAGSIGAGWGLAKDPMWSALMKNVLHHFEVALGG